MTSKELVKNTLAKWKFPVLQEAEHAIALRYQMNYVQIGSLQEDTHTIAGFILLIDILDSRRLPIIGWLDEVASLAILVQKMSKYITPEMGIKADEQLDKWFPSENCYVNYELIEG